MPYNFDEKPGMGFRQGLAGLKDMERQNKERERLLKERTDRVRKEAELLGMPKVEVAAAGVGELEAIVADRKGKEEERQRRAGKMMLERDQRAVAQTGQDFGALGEAQVRYFMGSTGVATTNEAGALWGKMGQADRALAFGVKDEKIIGRLMEDDRAVARLAAGEQERKRKEEAEAAGRALVGKTLELPRGNIGVYTSAGQLQVLPKEKEEKYEKEPYQGDYVRGPQGTVQEWDPAKEVYMPVRPDAVQVVDEWDEKKKERVKKVVEKDRWANVKLPEKRPVFGSVDEANAAKLPKGTRMLVFDGKKYRGAVVE
jgi:hypothetical protein